MTYVVALTGGIGSGKSTVANFFAELGVPIIDADIIARELVKPATPAYQQIVKKWGNTLLLANGELNRSLLRERIFSQPDAKIWLENLLHPLIREQIQLLIQSVQAPYCIVVIPLLAEHYADYQAIIDMVLVIDASPLQRQLRALQRDDVSVSLIQKMIASQASTAERKRISDEVIVNEGDLISLKIKVTDLHNKLLKTSISGKI